MFERYTERARRVIFYARDEASQFGSLSIETEHLLLGLLRENRSVMNRFLPTRSLAETVRQEIEQRMTRRERVSTSIDLPLSLECKRILAYAAEEAERLFHSQIGTEHLLLGMLREQNSVAGQILHGCGLKVATIRQVLVLDPLPREFEVSYEQRHLFTLLQSPDLPQRGVVADADTAIRIAEAIWIPLYGNETITKQKPLKTERKQNVWIVTGSPSAAEAEPALFAFILQMDGRILSVGRGPPT